MKPVPCPCCGESMEISADKKGKPYAACWPCGAQVFVKAKRGVAMFEQRYGADWKAAAPVVKEVSPPAPIPEPAAKNQPSVAPTPAPKPEPKPEPKRGSLLDRHIL